METEIFPLMAEVHRWKSVKDESSKCIFLDRSSYNNVCSFFSAVLPWVQIKALALKWRLH